MIMQYFYRLNPLRYSEIFIKKVFFKQRKMTLIEILRSRCSLRMTSQHIKHQGAKKAAAAQPCFEQSEKTQIAAAAFSHKPTCVSFRTQR